MELENESRRYKTELDEFRKEFQEIQNQEVTVLRLKEKLADYETQMEEMVKEGIKEANEKLQEENRKTIENLQEE